jgi:hypothetical protein
MRKLFLVGLLLMFAMPALPQVSGIKKSSSSNAKSGGSRDFGGSSGGGSGVYFFFNFVGTGIVNWQRAVLDKREEVPSVVSLEVLTQASVQPSNYYVFNPRVRGNWGIFLTDFRVNYLLEEAIGGVDDLTTLDWQVIGLNVVNTDVVRARISTGLLQENFGEHQRFNETVFGIHLNSRKRNIGGSAEYRWANDFTTGAVPRREWSASVERNVFNRKAAHGFATAGVQFQRYYSEVNVWGIQAGFALRLY